MKQFKRWLTLKKLKNNNQNEDVRRDERKSGFALIELIVVMSVIAILVLLAMPKFMSRNQDAKLTQAMNDAKVIENSLDEYLLKHDTFDEGLSKTDKAVLETLLAAGKLVASSGPITALKDGDYYAVPQDFIKEELVISKPGTNPVYISDGNVVVVETKDSYVSTGGSEGGEVPSCELVPEGYTLATDADFQFVKFVAPVWNPTAVGPPNSYMNEGVLTHGHYEYIGDSEYISIPKTIQGNDIKDYFEMFKNSWNVMGVASCNPNITSMEGMFDGADSDKPSYTIELKNFDTSNVTTMYNMFDSTYIYSLDLTAFDTSNVTDMTNFFFQSEYLDEINISSFDTSKVTSFSYMFFDIPAAIIDVSHFNTANVTDMSGMFESTEATTIDLSNFNTSKVIYMGDMFEFSNFTELDLRSFDTSNVEYMYNIFNGSVATALNLTSFNTSKVIDMAAMFNNSKVATLDLSNFDTSNVTDMSSMFAGVKVPVLDLSNFNTSKVTTLRYMFSYAEPAILNVASFDTRNVSSMYGAFQYINTPTLDLSSFELPKTTTSLQWKNAFLGAKATTGYGKDATQLTKLNDSWLNSKPGTLTFTIKP